MRPGWEQVVDLGKRKEIAEGMFGPIRWKTSEHGFGRCPGIGCHTGPDGPRDFEIKLNGVPWCHCFHSSCEGVVVAARKELRSKIGKAEVRRVSADGTGPTRKRTFALGRPTPFKRSVAKEIRGIRVDEMLAGEVGEAKGNTSRGPNVSRVRC